MQDFIQNLDRRWIYLLLLVAVLYPLIKPIGMPITISEWTEAFYAEVDKLQAGDVIMLAVDYTPAGGPDVAPQAVAMFQHAMEKNLRVVGVSFLADGPPLLQNILDPYMASGEKEYGVDFVNLGFVAGVETGISAFAGDMKRTAPADFFGTPTASLPLMKDINSVNDVDMVADFATGMPGPAEIVRQIGQNYKVTILCGVVTAMGPQTEPYYQSGQIKGLLSGLRSAAEYEVRNGTPGSAAAGMDAQSLGHIVIILAMAVGNLAYFLSVRKDKGGGQK